MVNPADAQLLDELRRAASQFDPPPPTVVEAARSSFTWRTIDAELAALVFDSGVDQPVTALRGGEGPRLMTFSSSGLDIEVEVINLGASGSSSASSSRRRRPISTSATPPARPPSRPTSSAASARMRLAPVR